MKGFNKPNRVIFRTFAVADKTKQHGISYQMLAVRDYTGQMFKR